jgi:hypothetical protein
LTSRPILVPLARAKSPYSFRSPSQESNIGPMTRPSSRSRYRLRPPSPLSDPQQMLSYFPLPGAIFDRLLLSSRYDRSLRLFALDRSSSSDPALADPQIDCPARSRMCSSAQSIAVARFLPWSPRHCRMIHKSKRRCSMPSPTSRTKRSYWCSAHAVDIKPSGDQTKSSQKRKCDQLFTLLCLQIRPNSHGICRRLSSVVFVTKVFEAD